MAAADVDAARRAIARHREWIVGVKVRLSESVCGDQDLEALRRARQAAGPLPVMLHVGQTFSPLQDRKSTRLNSSHRCISYAVFCLKKKNESLSCAGAQEVNGVPREAQHEPQKNAW